MTEQGKARTELEVLRQSIIDTAVSAAVREFIELGESLPVEFNIRRRTLLGSVVTHHEGEAPIEGPVIEYVLSAVADRAVRYALTGLMDLPEPPENTEEGAVAIK